MFRVQYLKMHPDFNQKDFFGTIYLIISLPVLLLIMLGTYSTVRAINLSLEPVESALVGNLLLCVFVWLYVRFIEKKKISELIKSRPVFRYRFKRFKSIYKYPVLIGCCFLIIILLMATLTGSYSEAVERYSNGMWRIFLITVLFVPVVEEFLFRGMITPLLCRIRMSFWAPYFSVLAFSILHTVGNGKDLIAFNFGIAVGPLILGLVCEAVLSLRLGLMAAISIHMAANASVMVFSLLDPRWLNWLSVFYL